MSELHVWDLDGTIRQGSLLAEAVLHGGEEGFIDLSRFQNPAKPTYGEVDYFVEAITQRSRRDFRVLTDRLSDEARDQAYPWALDRLEQQAKSEGNIVVLSHSPDFLVRAFCRGLEIKHARGSFFHTSDLVFSGRAIMLDKMRALKRSMNRLNHSQLDFAAGDSDHDLPILSVAEHAVIVNPDPRLSELAQTHDWEIIRTESETS
ncbi:MAG TPA: haloacid dehalogenase-like hydrolase [Candidatus Saccharimonadales bacterium]|jgi:phosphoserine phosphatase|nr:haloacid dehalogenase-like hydrolase [Candidatus Saccharimonadales bacterium]